MGLAFAKEAVKKANSKETLVLLFKILHNDSTSFLTFLDGLRQKGEIDINHLIKCSVDATKIPKEITFFHVLADNGKDYLGCEDYVEGLVKGLVERDANINTPDSNGCTPLHWAIDGGSPKVVEIFLRNNANPNIADSNGNFASHAAAKLGNVEILHLLHQYNANFKTPNNACKTPLNLAKSKKCTEAAQYIVKVTAQNDKKELKQKNDLREEEMHSSKVKKQSILGNCLKRYPAAIVLSATALALATTLANDVQDTPITNSLATKIFWSLTCMALASIFVAPCCKANEEERQAGL